MSEIKHTPGPWKVAGPVGAAIWITDESGNQIAMVYGPEQTPGGKANARLIAEAPRLLVVLKGMRQTFQMTQLVMDAESRAMARAILADVDLAIAKAEGRQ